MERDCSFEVGGKYAEQGNYKGQQSMYEYTCTDATTLSAVSTRNIGAMHFKRGWGIKLLCVSYMLHLHDKYMYIVYMHRTPIIKSLKKFIFRSGWCCMRLQTAKHSGHKLSDLLIRSHLIRCLYTDYMLSSVLRNDYRTTLKINIARTGTSYENIF